jgi:NitT/TauT family transport system substrate-binding protein
VTLSIRSRQLAAVAMLASLVLGACTPAASTSPSQAAPTTASTAAASTGTGGSAAPASGATGSGATGSGATGSGATGSGATGSGAPGGSGGTGELPKPEQATIQMGFSVTEMSQYAGVLAAQLGLYDKYGLHVEYSVFEGDAKVAQALQAGQVQIGFSGTSSAISSQLTDVPYDVVAVLAVILTDDLVCQKGIDTADEVKGKKIAISTFGGTSNAAALLALKALDLAATDAVITQVGGQSARLAALQGGSIDCAIIDSNMEAELVKAGFGIAAKLKEAKIPFGRSGMSSTEEWIKQNPNTTLVAVAGVLEAQNMIFTDPASVVPKYAEFTTLKEDEAKPQVDDFVEIGNRSLTWTDEAFKNPQKAIAAANPDIIDVDVTQAFDRSFLQKLADIGFYDKIGSPKPTQ